jgi:hypothetical protein
MPAARGGLAPARACFADDAGTRQRGLWTSAFALVVGRERLVPLDAMADVGFALRTGGRRCPSRHTVGGWRRHLRWDEVEACCRRTCPWPWRRGAEAVVRFDEHTRPRWTRQFRIGKGYVTTRNQSLRCAKRFYGDDVLAGRFRAVRGTPGGVGLADRAVPLVAQVRACRRPRSLPTLCDAGAGTSDADVRAWGDLADQHHRLDIPLRACRDPHRRRHGQRWPRGRFVAVAAPGVGVGAPAKEIRWADTQTVLQGAGPGQAIRTSVCREVAPGPKQDRWHPRHTRRAGFPEDGLAVFRARQPHAQAYRVGGEDAFLDAVPCGDDQESPDRQRPRCHRGPLPLLGWLVALGYHAVADLAERLAGDLAGAHVRTRRRRCFARPGQLYSTPEALVVYLDPFAGQEALVPVIDRFQAAGPRLPWLANRRLVISLTPRGRTRAGP